MTLHAHLDLVGGIAGDMFVAAMLDAFPDKLDSCLADLRASGVLNHVQVDLECGKCHGLAVRRFKVTCTSQQPARTGNYRDLRNFLLTSDLDEPVKCRSLSLLALLAGAEARVHGVAVEDVHFHEVADWDSITDLVAASSLIEHSGVTGWSCSQIPLGAGTVQTEHGILPVPAPAALELLQGFDVCDDGELGERVTPTGAALLRHVMSAERGPLNLPATRPNGTLFCYGVGAGQRTLQRRPNILRCSVMQTQTGTRADIDTGSESMAQFAHTLDEINELTFALDDMTPEEMAVAFERIRCTQGVLDVSAQPGLGKKGRAVFTVSVLCQPETEAVVSRACFSETSTLGIRIQHLNRRILNRREELVDDKDGSSRIKLAERPDCLSAKVASDDLQSLNTLEARREKAKRVSNQITCRLDAPAVVHPQDTDADFS
jgi:uncharacterized protein (TIGR00299 family) protein